MEKGNIAKSWNAAKMQVCTAGIFGATALLNTGYAFVEFATHNPGQGALNAAVAVSAGTAATLLALRSRRRTHNLG